MIDREALQSLLKLDALTDAQRNAVAALIEHGSYRAAARALGYTAHAAVQRAVARAMATSARLALGKAAPPIPFTPVRIATDGQGKVRSVTSRREPDAAAEGPHEPVPEGHAVKGISTYFGSDGSITGQWVKTDRKAQEQWEQTCRAIDEHMSRFAGAEMPVPAPAVPENVDKLRVTALLGDPHVGMMSWHLETGTDFDLKIADAQMGCAVDLLLSRSPLAGTFVLANLGDFFHAQDDTSLTPRGGNKLDVDGRFSKVVDIGFGMLRRFISKALLKYPRVRVINLPGNHDPIPARMLNKWIQAVYENEPRVEVLNNDTPYIFESFGENLHMFHHGDGCKPEGLAGVMSTHDKGRAWGQAEFRYAYTGHIHHLVRKEFPGMIWESSRTLAPGDYWHFHKGYRSGRGMRTVTHHADFGEIHSATVGVKEVELALVGLLKP